MGLLKKLVKLAFWLLALGVIALVGAVILVTAADPNDHKDWIEARMEIEMGRHITLDGNISLTLYPWLGLEAREVSIAGADGFGAEPFAYLDHIKVRVKTLPLLREEYEVDTIAVKGAVVNLVRNEQGITNWGDPDAGKDGTGDKRDEAMLPLAAVALGGVDIEDARITLDDRQAAVRYEISNLDVSTAELKYGEPVDINLSFHGSSNKPALESTVALSGIITYATDGEHFAVTPLEISADIKGGNIPGGSAPAQLSTVLDVNLGDGTVAFSDFTLSTLDATFRGNLSAQQVDSATPAMTATLDAQGSDLGLLFKVAEIEPLASDLARLADRSFQVSATVDADMERGDIDLSGLSANLLGSVIDGGVKVRNFHSDTPRYQGELNARGADLPTLMQVLGQLQGGDSALAAYGMKLAGVPAKAFRLETVFDADLESGDIAVPSLSLEALGVNATGTLDARDMDSRKGRVVGNLNIRGNRIAGLLTALDQAGLAQVLQSVELDTRVEGTGKGISLETMSLKAVFAGEDIPGSPATMTLNADTRLDLDEETLVFDRFALGGLGLTTSGRVEVNDIYDNPAVSGRLEVLPFNLRRLARQLQQELPETQGEDTYTRVSLAGRFDHSAAGLNLDRLELQLDDSLLSGEFLVNREASRPVVKFYLDVDQIDLDRYLPPESATGPAPAGEDAGLAALPIVVAAGTDMDGDLSVGRLIVADARLDGFRLRVTARDGVVQVNPVTAALYEGRLNADVSLDTNPDLPVLLLNLDLAEIQAEPLLMDMTGKARLRGKGDFRAALSAQGTSIDAMKRSLEGQMSLNFTQGAIAGFNLGRALRQWQQLAKDGIMNLEARAETDFTEFSGNPVAKSGVIRMDDLVLNAPAFRLRGAGVLANLHTGAIDYQGMASVVNTAEYAGGDELAELEGLELPVKVEGQLDDPKIRLAWEDILSGLLINKVFDVLDIQVPGREQPEDTETSAEPEEESEFDPVKELLKEGLKEGLKGIFKKN